MNTVWLLLGRYEGKALLTVQEVARDFFGHLSAEKLIRKVDGGEISLPLIRIEGSSKAARYVDIRDLASYLDSRRKEARDVAAKISGHARWS